MTENGTWYKILSEAVAKQLELLAIPQRIPEHLREEPSRGRRWEEGHGEASLLVEQFIRKEVIPVRQRFEWNIKESLKGGQWMAKDLESLFAKAKDIRSKYDEFSHSVRPSSSDPRFSAGFADAIDDKRETAWRALYDFDGFKRLLDLYENWKSGNEYGIGHKVDTDERRKSILHAVASESDDYDFDEVDPSEEDVQNIVKLIRDEQAYVPSEDLLGKVKEISLYARARTADEGRTTEVKINPGHAKFSPPGDPESLCEIKALRLIGQEVSIVYNIVPGSASGAHIYGQYISLASATNEMPWLVEATFDLLEGDHTRTPVLSASAKNGFATAVMTSLPQEAPLFRLNDSYAIDYLMAKGFLPPDSTLEDDNIDRVVHRLVTDTVDGIFETLVPHAMLNDYGQEYLSNQKLRTAPGYMRMEETKAWVDAWVAGRNEDPETSTMEFDENDRMGIAQALAFTNLQGRFEPS